MNKYTYEHPRPGLTSDIALFKLSENDLQVLLIKRGDYPYEGCWALPGGFVDEGETAELAAERELMEETHITGIQLQQVYTTTTPGRDPRGWTVSVIFTGFVNNEVQAIAGDDASEVKWFSINKLPEMAFDHAIVFQKVLNQLKDLLHFKIFGYQLLEKDFELPTLKKMFLQLLNSEEESEKLLIRLTNSHVLRREGDGYSFDMQKVDEILNKGWC